MLDVNLIFSRPGFSLSAAFTLHAGGITVLRGDSGSGKTTLADLLSGAIAPQKRQIISDGDIWFDAASGINLRLKNAKSASYFRLIGFFRTSPSKKTFVSPFCSATASRYWHLTNL